MNGTVFTYGQTGSGKTFTMRGDNEREGIIPLAARDIFDAIHTDNSSEYVVKISYMEIYNRELRDLLVDKSTKEPAALKIMDEAGIVQNLSEAVVHSFDEFMQTFVKADSNKTVGSTNMNQVSSRSHSILKVTVEKRVEKENVGSGATKTVSTLSLVDLAGSENAKLTGAEGQRQKEGGNINKRYVD